ncbi:MAG: nucleotidyltransferase family protein [Aliiglaciecola sp.]|uniref:nucleotidyltransferase family protein n=1 Tax=Aliiglaciecola sp. TaxID=1872441 RepID=UPI003299F982
MDKEFKNYNSTDVLNIAIEHGVAAVLARVIETNQSQKSFFKDLTNFQLHQNLRNQLIDQQYYPTLIKLSEAGIHFVVLKGYALSHTVYPTPLLRTKADVDIIIRIDDKDAVINAFKTMGFSNPRGWNPTAIINQFSMRKTLSPGVNVDFDIHLRLSNERGVENIITFDELLKAADTNTLQNVPLVSKPYALIHAIVHMLHHRNVGDTVKLIWLYDLLLLCQTMNPDEKQTFRKLIDKKGLTKLANFALNLANSYFSDPSLVLTIEKLRDASSNSELDYLITIETRYQQFKRSFKQRESVLEKWMYIKEMAFPPAAEVYRKYGKKPAYYLPFLYIRRFIGGVIKHLSK